MIEEEEDEFFEERRKKKSKNKKKNKRRFSDEQISSLETIFKTEKKLDPNKKIQLAREVGLQPRQVAIWFQNKRARWKSKQLEEDYNILKADYDNLCAMFESLKNDKQSLLIQLQRLNALLKQPQDTDMEIKQLKENNNISEKSISRSLNEEQNQRTSMNSEDERGTNWYYKNHEEEEEEKEHNNIVPMSEKTDGSLNLGEKLCKFDSVSSSLLDQSGGSSNWWDLWT